MKNILEEYVKLPRECILSIMANEFIYPIWW
jgi:hypothetical protein